MGVVTTFSVKGRCPRPASTTKRQMRLDCRKMKGVGTGNGVVGMEMALLVWKMTDVVTGNEDVRLRNEGRCYGK